MKTDISYEVIDLRDVDQTHKMLSVAMVQPMPGGLSILALNRRGLFLDLESIPDDEAPIEDHEDQGRLIVHTEEGTIVLEALGLDNWRKNVLPFFGDDGQVFSRDKEVNDHYYQRLREME
jgi:hypothetical protein